MKYFSRVFFLNICLFSSFSVSSQSKWFSLYSDSSAMVKDANTIVQDIKSTVQKANPALKLDANTAIKNTSPYLIYIDLELHTVNLPLWTEVIPEQKGFFAEVSGGEAQAKEVFGLFFNGFYLAHEYGHAFSANAGKDFSNAFDSEYDANVFAMLYWRKAGKEKELLLCYNYAKKMLQTLKDPVPQGEDYKQYMTKHYQELSSDPYKYGYIQFKQFVEVYESKAFSNFDAFVKNYK
jgi:hypothetical protein